MPDRPDIAAWHEENWERQIKAQGAIDKHIAMEVLQRLKQQLREFLREYNLINEPHPLRFRENILFMSLPGEEKARSEKGGPFTNALIFDLTKITSIKELKKLFWDMVEKEFLKHFVSFHDTACEIHPSLENLCKDRYLDFVQLFFIAYLGIQPDEIVVDMGTGAFPVMALAAAQWARKVYALDISSKAIKVSKQEAAQRSLSNIEFLQATGTAIPITSETIDRVIFDPFFVAPGEIKMRILKEIYRILKPRGRIDFKELISLGGRKLLWTDEQWLSMFDELGFRFINVVYGGYGYRFPTYIEAMSNVMTHQIGIIISADKKSISPKPKSFSAPAISRTVLESI